MLRADSPGRSPALSLTAVGAKPVPTGRAFNLRLSEERDRELAELAQLDGVSKNEAVARAIEAAWARRSHQGQVRQLAREGIGRYGPLLDRLAQ